MGSGEADNFAGKVYHFGGYVPSYCMALYPRSPRRLRFGSPSHAPIVALLRSYEFFPIPPPVFDPPPGSYLLPGGPLTLDAITGLPSEQVYYEFGENNTNPDPFKSAHAKGHKITLPYVCWRCYW